MTIEDEQAIEGFMRTLAQGSERDTPSLRVNRVLPGWQRWSGCAVIRSAQSRSGSQPSRVLIISTEGATAPREYTRLVGQSAEQVLQRQQAWQTAHALQNPTCLNRRHRMYVDTELGTQMVRWRRELHQFPETGFNEHKTAAFVAAALQAMGLEVHQGIGGTGLVASLTVGEGPGRDRPARRYGCSGPATETAQGREHISRNPGCMHGCGHDGHMAMLLGAARSPEPKP